MKPVDGCCRGCGAKIVNQKLGRPRIWCSALCRKRTTYRQGLANDKAPTPEALEARFTRQTAPGPNGCVDWVGPINRQTGYGQITLGGRTRYVHHIALELVGRATPKWPQECVDHLCRRTVCVNPDHLEVVAQGVNVRRGRATKLTTEDVAEIRSLVQNWTGTLRGFGKEYSERFGVAPGYLVDIATGRRRAAA